MENSILIKFTDNEIYTLEYILTKALEERINFPEDISDEKVIMHEAEVNECINQLLIKIAQAKLDINIPKFDN